MDFKLLKHIEWENKSIFSDYYLLKKEKNLISILCVFRLTINI